MFNKGLGVDMGSECGTKYLWLSAEEHERLLRASDEWDNKFWEEMLAQGNEFGVGMGRSWMGESMLCPFFSLPLISDHDCPPFADSHISRASSIPWSQTSRDAADAGVEIDDGDAEWELDPEWFAADVWQTGIDPGFLTTSPVHEDFLGSNSHRVRDWSLHELEKQSKGPSYDEESEVDADQDRDLEWQLYPKIISEDVDMDMSAVDSPESNSPPSLDRPFSSYSTSRASSASSVTAPPMPTELFHHDWVAPISLGKHDVGRMLLEPIDEEVGACEGFDEGLEPYESIPLSSLWADAREAFDQAFDQAVELSYQKD